MKSLKELFLNAENAESFTPERLQHLEATLIEDHRSDLPWYLRVIVAIGAWLASCFFLGFALVLIGSAEKNQSTIGITGVVLLVLAVVVGRQSLGVFVGQCALAVSLAAQAMIYFGFVDEHQHPLGTVTALSIGLATLLYIAYPSFLSRVMTCLAALQITLLWIYAGVNGDPFGNLRAEPELEQLLFIYWTLHLAGIAGCFLKPRHAVFLAPLGYALVASLTAWQLENLFDLWARASAFDTRFLWEIRLLFPARLSLTALTLFVVAVWAAGGVTDAREKAPLFIGLALALVFFVWLGPGGILLALLYLLLGFSLQNRPILGLGLLLLPVFLGHYYYSLNLDLLAKSGVLIGSGIVLLMLRSGLSRWTLADQKEAA